MYHEGMTHVMQIKEMVVLNKYKLQDGEDKGCTANGRLKYIYWLLFWVVKNLKYNGRN